MRDRAGYLVYRVLAAGFGALPEAWVRVLGRWLGGMAYHVAGGRRRMAQRHMRRVLGPDADVAAAAREVFAEYGRYWAEVFWVTPHRKAEIIADTTVVGMSNWHSVRDAGKGAIFALPHLGNWEAAGARSEAEGARALAVAEALPNRELVDWFIRVRNQLGIDVIIAERGTQVTRSLRQRLAEGGVVALMSDRDLKGRGVPVTFFGEETTMPAGPASLAERTGAGLLPIAAYFKEGRGHELWVNEAIPVPDLPTREERVAAMTQTLAHEFEGLIRRHPTQWHLLVPNWPSDREVESR
jgi:KDO2-lipid IV(A) lauroyltransferase